MTDKSPVEIRMELARGHILLEEYDSAVPCLERAVEAAPDSERLAALVGELAAALAGGEPDLVARTEAMLAKLRTGAAPVLPELDAPLGQVVRTDGTGATRAPDPGGLSADVRERIRTLEGWLENLRARHGRAADDVR